MGASIFLEVDCDYARQHSLTKLEVSRTSENPGNHSIAPIFLCRVSLVLSFVCCGIGYPLCHTALDTLGPN